MDSKPLNIAAIPVGYCYVLDTAALVEDQEVENYISNYRLRWKSPAVFILTPPVLRELDKRKDRSFAYQWSKRLLDWSKAGRLSSGPIINASNDRIYLVKVAEEQLITRKFNFLDRDYADRYILKLAGDLKAAGRRVAVVSRDSLMRVLCNEAHIRYIYMSTPDGSPRSAVPLRPSATQPIPQITSKESQSSLTTTHL